MVEKINTQINEGDDAPNFSLSADHGKTVSLADFTGSNIVLFFYPKDNTPGCTKEAIEFSDKVQDFEKHNTVILGLSPDSARKHDNFVNKHDLQVTLISDEEKKTLEDYQVWVEKSMYGKKYMGVDRSTFLIDTQGRIVKIWRKVKVAGHVEDVFEAVQNL